MRAEDRDVLPLLNPPRRTATRKPSGRFPRLRRFGLAAVALSSCAASLSLRCASPQPPRPLDASLAPEAPGRIAVVGDLQRTSGWEFWREQNDNERSKVVWHIAAGRPSLVLMLGDLVFDGSSEREWEAFDELVAPIREGAIPSLTVVGNHELWAGGRGNLRHVFDRFPLLAGATWTTTRVQSIGLVLLDSNRDRLTEDEWERQKAWLAATLAALDADPTIRAVVVAAHHPAFTNSTVTGDEPAVQEELVPLLEVSRKAVLVLAGHVHSYEHFERKGRHFVVSGGGGGPRARLASGANRRHPDDRANMPVLRPLHMLWICQLREGIEVEVEGFPQGDASLGRIDRFLIPWPR